MKLLKQNPAGEQQQDKQILLSSATSLPDQYLSPELFKESKGFEFGEDVDASTEARRLQKDFDCQLRIAQENLYIRSQEVKKETW